jgi:hypothetical protein
VGRFTSPDPSTAAFTLGISASWNQYSYGVSDPIGNIDPQGLLFDSCSVVGCLMAPPEDGGGILWAGGPVCALGPNSLIGNPLCVLIAGGGPLLTGTVPQSIWGAQDLNMLDALFADSSTGLSFHSWNGDGSVNVIASNPSAYSFLQAQPMPFPGPAGGGVGIGLVFTLNVVRLIYDHYLNSNTHLAPMTIEQAVANQGWNFDRAENRFTRNCPKGSARSVETIKWDPGSYGEIPHWDHRTCDGDKRKQKPNSKIYVGGKVQVFYWPY